ncbi:hypothetical protein ES703_62256 [subsurface metagenome]
MKKYLKLFLEAVRVIRLYKNWFEIISNHFKAGKDTTDLILRNGIRYKIHPRNTDMGLIQEIHSENIYQIRRGDISRNGVVIDIGAHIGIFSVYAATQAEGVTVYSYEPDPDNHQLLLKNIEINRLESRVRPFNVAVSDTATPRTLIRSADSLSAHSFFANKFPEGEVKDSVEVSCTTLADVFQKYAIEKCDVLKLDCEGEEYNILLNTPDGVLCKIAKIVAEYHDGLTEYTHRDLADFLSKRNFKVNIKESRSFATFNVGFLCAINILFKPQ